MENPQDELRASLESAYETASEPQEAATDVAVAEPAEAPTGRARDDHGRFAPNEPTEPAQIEQQAAAPAVEAPAVEPAAAPVIETRAPSSWRPEVRPEFEKLPPSVQETILKRESEYHSGITQYKQHAQVGHSFQQAVAPYAQTIQQLGVDAPTAAAKLFQADHLLRHGDQATKAQLFGQMARDYGIDLAQVANPPQVDPQLSALYQQLQHTQQEVNGWKQQQQQQQMAVLHSEIQQFASDPANVHFEKVSGDMARLLESGMAEGIKDAYDKAVWGRSDTRQSLIERERAEAQTNATKAAQSRRAQSAAVGVRGSSPMAGGTQPAKGSLREQLEASFDQS